MLNYTGVIPISLFLLATGTVLRKPVIGRGVRLMTVLYGCRYRETVFTSNNEENCMLYADLYLIGTTFTNNNSTRFHLSHLFKLTQH